MIGLILWFPNQILTRLLRPLEDVFDQMADDVRFLVRAFEEAQK